MDGRSRPHIPSFEIGCRVRAEGFGALAQLGEHLLCKQGVVGSIPTGSTNRAAGSWLAALWDWVGSSGG
jgi:hypothetical protein